MYLKKRFLSILGWNVTLSWDSLDEHWQQKNDASSVMTVLVTCLCEVITALDMHYFMRVKRKLIRNWYICVLSQRCFFLILRLIWSLAEETEEHISNIWSLSRHGGRIRKGLQHMYDEFCEPCHANGCCTRWLFVKDLILIIIKALRSFVQSSVRHLFLLFFNFFYLLWIAVHLILMILK